jgi:PAS domain S-box-containing protein
VPFRPGQVLGLGAGLVGLVALIGIPNPLVGSVGGGLPVVYSQLVFVCILSVLLTGVSGVLYGRHWSRIRSQEALAENRRLLHETETLAKIGGWSIDLRSGEARATPQVYDIFGVDPRQSLSPETMARQFPPDVRAALETAFERCREEGVPYHLVLPLDEEADETRWVRVHGTARTVEGQVVEILGAVQDVTWHRRREQETKEQQALLHAVTENVSEGIYRSHPDEGLVYANPAFADLFGYDSVDALLNVESPELYADPDVRAELAERLHEQGTLEGEEVRYRRADGSEFIGRLTSTLVRGEDGTPKYYDGIVADITERKRRERTLRKAKERAEEANRIKSSLLSTMNHEFRTPLTSILSFAEVVERDPSLADEFIGRIRSGGTRLLRTLNTVMDFARLEGNEMDPTPQSLDVTEIAAAVVDDFRPDAERRDLGLQLNRPDEAVEVVLDPHALERVYTHLVSNALKFTKAGRVTVGAREDGDVVELWVRDTGIGIDPADRPAILDEFTQASSGADRTHEGNGLGLTIVKRLTERMGGSVEIDSAVGQGTCVTVRVPKTDPSARSSAQSGSGLASAEET